MIFEGGFWKNDLGPKSDLKEMIYLILNQLLFG